MPRTIYFPTLIEALPEQDEVIVMNDLPEFEDDLGEEDEYDPDFSLHADQVW